MPPVGGLEYTGKKIKAPAANLCEMQAETGEVYSSLVFDSEYRLHQALNLDVVYCRVFFLVLKKRFFIIQYSIFYKNKYVV